MKIQKTVAARIPEEWIILLNKYVIGPSKEYPNISDYLRNLVREDIKRRGLFEVLENSTVETSSSKEGQ